MFDDEDKPLNEIFIITGISTDKFKRFMEDNDPIHIADERREHWVKMEILDYYPDSTPLSSLPYITGFEKVWMPDIELYTIELKGHHILPNTKGAGTSRSTEPREINNSRAFRMINNELKSIVIGSGLYRRCKDYSSQLSLLNTKEIYHFTLTEGTGKRRYLTSLIFFELSLDIKNKRAYLIPMVYSLISPYPIFNIQKQFLETIFNDCIK